MTGLGADLRQVWLVTGTMAGGPPATYGDLASAGFSDPLDQQQLQVQRQAGATTIQWTDSWSWTGAIGDLVWFGVVVSPVFPTGTDPLVAVAGPFPIGP